RELQRRLTRGAGRGGKGGAARLVAELLRGERVFTNDNRKRAGGFYGEAVELYFSSRRDDRQGQRGNRRLLRVLEHRHDTRRDLSGQRMRGVGFEQRHEVVLRAVLIAQAISGARAA